MVLKHMEMDGIIRQIYSAISNLPHLENTLLILCGDHGMNDGGNHGGSAPGETETALLFVSPKLRTLSPSGRKCPVTPKNGAFEFYTTVEQSDLAPTITSLLGLPIPRNNLGVLIPDFLRLWKDCTCNHTSITIVVIHANKEYKADDQLQLLLRNALQILSNVKAQFPGLDFENVQEDCQVGDHPLVCEWKIASKAIQGYRETGGSVSPALTRLYKVNCLPYS
jgi:ethanolaminephosphotransferase